jgi:hypothetical protein
MRVRETVGSVLAPLAGVETTIATDGSVTWSVGDIVFADASADGATASVRLDPVLATAARRTPDTSESPRGSEWVAFAPTVVDAHAVDRAAAWAAAAHRRAVR